MIAVALATLPIFFTGRRISRGEGVLFLGYYAAYTAFLVLSATQHDALEGFTRALLVVMPATVVAMVWTYGAGRRRADHAG